MYDAELDSFKRDINLVDYARSECGYERLRRESSRASHVLKHPQTGDKVVVAQASDGHWTYFSVRDDRDNGSIIDFVQRRTRKNLGEVRAALRTFARRPRPLTPASPPPAPSPQQRDELAVVTAWAAAHEAPNSLYLNLRGIRPETLSETRFSGSWKEDSRQNVLFVHRDGDGVTGFEVKNERFTGFAPGGTRTLWQSAATPDDRRLVVAESAIDAISYHQLHPEHAEFTRYVSTGGAPGPTTIEALRRVLEDLAPNSTVVAATDADEGGQKLATKLQDLTKEFAHLTFVEHRPTQGKDWNEVLKKVEQEFVLGVRGALARKSPER